MACVDPPAEAEQSIDVHQRIANAFRSHDPQQVGSIDHNQMMRMLRVSNPACTLEDFEAILAKSGATNVDGAIDYNVFLQWVFGHIPNKEHIDTDLKSDSDEDAGADEDIHIVPTYRRLSRRMSREETFIVTRASAAELQDTDIEHITQALAKTLPCRGLQPLDLECFAQSFFVVDFKASEFVTLQGEIGSYYFVIKCGEAVAETSTGEFLRRMSAGDAFGEIALIKCCLRTASVRAAENLTLYACIGSDFSRFFRGQMPVELVQNIDKARTEVYELLGDMYHRSEKVATWLDNAYNLERHIIRCGDTEKAVEWLRTDLSRRFRLRCVWDGP